MRANIDVIRSFMKRENTHRGNSVLVRNNMLYCYDTCIVYIDTSDIIPTIWFNVTRYSVTTSKMQSYVIFELGTLLFKYKEVRVNIVSGIPRNTRDITNKKYLKQSLFFTNPTEKDIDLISFMRDKYKNV